MADDPPKDLSDALAEGRALVICGAGVSRAATDGKAPGWALLIKDALAEAAARGKGGMKQPWAKACKALLSSKLVEDWLRAADTIQEKLAPPDGPFRAFFVTRLGSLTATWPPILEAIEKIGSRNRIATTNYDHLISQALGWDRADWTDHQRVIEALRGGRPAVWHIHGDFDRPDSIIFSQSDYERIAESELPQFVQRSAGLAFTLVFVCCSASGLSDDNVGRLLDWMYKGFSGLGDRHFVLVTDHDKDLWPKSVTPVRFGDLADLPSYLGKLTRVQVSSATLPPDPQMIGRKNRLNQLVATILENNRPIVVPGARGMGKTTLALAAAYDPRVVARFGKSRRFLVGCDDLQDANSLLHRLATDLGLAVSGDAEHIATKIEATCAEAPALAILDNLETLWSKDTSAAEERLGRLAAIGGLRLVLIFRGKPPKLPGPGGEMLQDVERLSEAEARALFLRHAGDHLEGDPALAGLLILLGGRPQAIENLAERAAGRSTLMGLLDSAVRFADSAA